MFRLRGLFRLAVARGLKTDASRVASEEINPKDVFGTLSESGSKSLAVSAAERLIPDDPDGYDKEEFDLEPRKNHFYYHRAISKDARLGPTGIKKALELFNQMKSKDKLIPEFENFSVLIYGCSKAGFTKQAFDLYLEMLKHHKRPSRSVVTAMINSCAECPLPDYGIERLEWFLDHLAIDLNFSLNLTHFNCVLKSYGKFERLDKVMEYLKRISDEGLKPDTATFNMVLGACWKHKEAGATMAFRVYKRMKMMNISPDIHTYLVLLYCIRDCRMGSPELIKEALDELPQLTRLNLKLFYKYLELDDSKTDTKTNSKTKRFEYQPQVISLDKLLKPALRSEAQPQSIKSLPLKTDHPSSPASKNSGKIVQKQSSTNLVDMPNPHDLVITGDPRPIDSAPPNLLMDDHLRLMNHIEAIDFQQLETKTGRFALFGGMRGYLEQLVRDKCKPNAQIFAAMIPCIPHRTYCQDEFLQLSREHAIVRTHFFYDKLIRHVCENLGLRNRVHLAKRFIQEMQLDNLRPDVGVFESLALGCDSVRDTRNLVASIKSCGFTVTPKIVKRLFYAATNKKDFNFVLELIALAESTSYRPQKSVVECLEQLRLDAHKVILGHERGRKISSDDRPDWLTDANIKAYDAFNTRLGRWLSNVELNEEDTDHPWAQYEVESSSKRRGYVEFASELKDMLQLKQEAIEKGQPLGNVAEKARAKRERESLSKPPKSL